MIRRLVTDPRLTTLNARNSYGTPLMCAVDSAGDRNVEAVELMLRVPGVELGTRNSWGRTLKEQAV